MRRLTARGTTVRTKFFEASGGERMIVTGATESFREPIEFRLAHFEFGSRRSSRLAVPLERLQDERVQSLFISPRLLTHHLEPIGQDGELEEDVVRHMRVVRHHVELRVERHETKRLANARFALHQQLRELGVGRIVLKGLANQSVDEETDVLQVQQR